MIQWPTPDPGLELTVASRGISRGLVQTEGPQVQARAVVNAGDVQVGALVKNVSSPVADGQGSAFLNFGRRVGPYRLTAGISYRFRVGIKQPSDSESIEFVSSVSRRLGRFGSRLAMNYTPDDLGTTRRSIILQSETSYDLAKRTSFSVMAGERWRTGNSDYFYYNLGITQRLVPNLSADVRLHGTAQGYLGPIYRKHLVFSLRAQL